MSEARNLNQLTENTTKSTIYTVFYASKIGNSMHVDSTPIYLDQAHLDHAVAHQNAVKLQWSCKNPRIVVLLLN